MKSHMQGGTEHVLKRALAFHVHVVCAGYSYTVIHSTHIFILTQLQMLKRLNGKMETSF